jgi:hypothetical protein
MKKIKPKKFKVGDRIKFSPRSKICEVIDYERIDCNHVYKVQYKDGFSGWSLLDEVIKVFITKLYFNIS